MTADRINTKERSRSTASSCCALLLTRPEKATVREVVLGGISRAERVVQAGNTRLAAAERLKLLGDASSGKISVGVPGGGRAG